MDNFKTSVALDREAINVPNAFFVGSCITEASDIHIRSKAVPLKKAQIILLYFSGTMLTVASILIFVVVFPEIGDDEWWWAIPLLSIACLFLLLIGLICYRAARVARHEVIFNRKDGTIAHAKHYFTDKQVVYPYSARKIFRLTYEDVLDSGIKRKWALIILFRVESYGHDDPRQKMADYWAFLDHYMDSTKPLPPGSAFDAYR